MPIPPADQIRAASRGLRSVEHDGESLKVLTVERRYAGRIEDVWDALTSPDRIPRWFTPITGDLRLGGTYQLTGNAGGTILACDAPRSLSITWEFGGQVSWVDLELSEDPTSADGEATLLTLTHRAPVDQGMWDQFGPGAVGIGWESALMGLAEHIAAPDSDPEEVQAWMAGPEGTVYLAEFMTACSRKWAEASIAFGTDPEIASAAAARCTAAYLGVPDAPADAPTDAAPDLGVPDAAADAPADSAADAPADSAADSAADAPGERPAE